MQELLDYTKALQSNIEGLTKSLESTLNNTLKNISKEDAIKYKEALNDPAIIEAVKKINDFNAKK